MRRCWDRPILREGGGPHKATNGCVLEVPSGEVVATGLAMPHSPRVRLNRLWVLNSGLGEVTMVTLPSGQMETVVELPGYPRGLALAGQLAFVGLSKARETATFGSVAHWRSPRRPQVWGGDRGFTSRGSRWGS